MYSKLIMVGLFCLLSLSVLAEPQTFNSGQSQVMLVELYTSEGCSSCPPAENFLNQLQHDNGLWQTFVPMAFHVDYWNDLGWRDRFSTAAYSQRQRRYARFLHSRTVYTPEFFINGREWRRGYINQLPVIQQKAAGALKVSVDHGHISGTFISERPLSGLRVHTALLGMGLSTSIKSGERAGHTTRHEFVVLGHHEQALQGDHFTSPLPAPSVAASRYAVAVWLSRGNNPTPIQAVGGMLDSLQ